MFGFPRKLKAQSERSQSGCSKMKNEKDVRFLDKSLKINLLLEHNLNFDIFKELSRLNFNLFNKKYNLFNIIKYI